jgi:putative oxidoreductase
MNTLPSNAGRIIFGLIFLAFGFFHMTSAAMMAEWMPAWVPIPLVLVYLSGAGLVAAGISIILKLYTKLATRLLAVLLLLIILMLDLPGAIAGDQTAMSMMLKDSGLLGAALYMSGHFKK